MTKSIVVIALLAAAAAEAQTNGVESEFEPMLVGENSRCAVG